MPKSQSAGNGHHLCLSRSGGLDSVWSAGLYHLKRSAAHQLAVLSSAAQSVGEGGGIRDQLFNSLYLLVLTLLISTPLSIGAGIFLAEYAPKMALRKSLRPRLKF